MARRREQKERQRREREEAEGREAAEARRRRLVGIATAGVLVAAIVAAVVVVAISSGGSSGESSDAGDPFATHYDGLAARRAQAGVPVMSDISQGGAHIHPVLAVYANGEQVDVPANIGIDPAQPPEQMAGLHTHDETGTIHVENAANPTLGQFFEVWGVPFSAKQLGPYENRGDKRVRMWVDGQPSRAFGDLALEDGQQVVVAYATAKQIPEGLPER
jgi:hypothetical protein